MNKYRCRYTWQAGKTLEVGVKDLDAPNPISALNQFHGLMQMSQEVNGFTREVERPMLKPDQYKIESFYHIYHATAFERDVSSTPLVESLIDLPASPNPTLEVGKGQNAFQRDPEFNF